MYKRQVSKLDQLLNKVNKGEIDVTLANLTVASAELKDTLANFNEISEMLRGGEGTLGALIIDPSIYDNLKGILGEAERSKFVRAAVRYLVDQEQENGAEAPAPN